MVLCSQSLLLFGKRPTQRHQYNKIDTQIGFHVIFLVSLEEDDCLELFGGLFHAILIGLTPPSIARWVVHISDLISSNVRKMNVTS